MLNLEQERRDCLSTEYSYVLKPACQVDSTAPRSSDIPQPQKYMTPWCVTGASRLPKLDASSHTYSDCDELLSITLDIKVSA